MGKGGKMKSHAAEQWGASAHPPGVLQSCTWSEDTRRASTALLIRSKIEH